MSGKRTIWCGQRINLNDMCVAPILQWSKMMRSFALPARVSFALFAAVFTALLIAQPPPPRPDGRDAGRRIADIRNRLERTPPVTPQQKELAAFAERYLQEAEHAFANGKRSQAQQLADAADACRRPIDHMQRLAGVKAPPPPPPPGPAGDPANVQRHLRQVYFRLRLADYFVQQIPPPAPSRLQQLAREFYDQAAQAEQAHRLRDADECAKAADDLTHALESLAQAALP